MFATRRIHSNSNNSLRKPNLNSLKEASVASHFNEKRPYTPPWSASKSLATPAAQLRGVLHMKLLYVLLDQQSIKMIDIKRWLIYIYVLHLLIRASHLAFILPSYLPLLRMCPYYYGYALPVVTVAAIHLVDHIAHSPRTVLLVCLHPLTIPSIAHFYTLQHQRLVYTTLSASIAHFTYSWWRLNTLERWIKYFILPALLVFAFNQYYYR